MSIFDLPKSPYPGLRPFLDNESSLLHGREPQVEAIVERLMRNQFVAVVGGSGSGKSSLVRAGVIPKLRRYGIPEAGDYWIPIVFTPSTTEQMALSDANEAAIRKQTPITRLAWKFSQQLESAYKVDEQSYTAEKEKDDGLTERSAQRLADRKRRDEISDVFRRSSGFSRLINAYTEQLPANRPDPSTARFLFVIDQFEELFHANNRTVDDTRLLIEAIIDHFFNPDPRCYVILTMRSERLADCAAYLELPDAINDSVYLIRRLDEGELRGAITDPASTFLRMLHRGVDDPTGGRLPDEVTFDEDVIERLLHDAEALSSDPDHLPLLQHLLARLWEVATHRSNAQNQVAPDKILWSDLEAAAAPISHAGQPSGWLREQDDDRKNVLRACLEEWCDLTYRRKTGDGQQATIDAVLRHLAFKNLDDGTYNQQRIDVDNPAWSSKTGFTRDSLKKLLDVGFLDSVNYLFWDDENPDRITLKVSHEALIRGWPHFRGLIDREAERLQEFQGIVRKCGEWRKADQADNREMRLLSEQDLQRARDAQLDILLSDPAQRNSWIDALRQYRDGEQLLPVGDDVATYFRQSQDAVDTRIEQARRKEEEVARAQQRTRELELQKQAQAREFKLQEQAQAAKLELADRKKTTWIGIAVTACVIAVIGGVSALYVYFIQIPLVDASLSFAKARSFVDRQNQIDLPRYGAANMELNTLLQAAAEIEGAKQPYHDFKKRAGRYTLFFETLSPFSRSQNLLVFQNTGPLVNGKLRQRLTTGIWEVMEQSPLGKSSEDPKNNQKSKQKQCTNFPGRLYTDRSGTLGIVEFVPGKYSNQKETLFYPASINGNECKIGAIIDLPFSPNKDRILFDSELRHILTSIERPNLLPAVVLYKIVWGSDSTKPRAGVLPLTQIVGCRATMFLDMEMEQPGIKQIETRNDEGGIIFKVANRSWKLFANEAREIASKSDNKTWPNWEDKDSMCNALERKLESQKLPDYSYEIYQNKEYCLRVGTPAPNPPEKQSAEWPMHISVAVYEKPPSHGWLDAAPDIQPIANIPDFASPDRISGGGKWVYQDDSDSQFGGWIAYQKVEGQDTSYLGTPWSTQALKKLTARINLTNQPDFLEPIVPGACKK